MLDDIETKMLTEALQQRVDRIMNGSPIKVKVKYDTYCDSVEFSYELLFQYKNFVSMDFIRDGYAYDNLKVECVKLIRDINNGVENYLLHKED